VNDDGKVFDEGTNYSGVLVFASILAGVMIAAIYALLAHIK
jgi:hypothetical protein